MSVVGWYRLSMVGDDRADLPEYAFVQKHPDDGGLWLIPASHRKDAGPSRG